ncbi:MAG: hypothetical protein H0U57_13170 [Tatlockia sp.]|nr:hypothetical protein [Tatlockia sp.]
MLIKIVRFVMIILILFILFGLLLVFIGQFINLNELLNQLNNFLKTHTFFFLLFRLFLYGAAFCLWPWFIRWSIAGHPNPVQINTMLSARHYLLATILIQEFLNWLR